MLGCKGAPRSASKLGIDKKIVMPHILEKVQGQIKEVWRLIEPCLLIGTREYSLDLEHKSPATELGKYTKRYLDLGHLFSDLFCQKLA